MESTKELWVRKMLPNLCKFLYNYIAKPIYQMKITCLVTSFRKNIEFRLNVKNVNNKVKIHCS